jgi:hypothetical protein
MQNTPPPEVTTFLAAYPKKVRDIALELRRLVLELAPGAIEQVDIPAKMLAYGFAATYKDTICVITPQKDYVNLGLPRGAELPDPAGLLTGTGKRARHVRVSAIENAGGAALRGLVMESVKLTGSGV